MATIHRLTGPMSKRLRDARIDAGLTQQQIHELTGISLKSVGNYESERYRGARKRYAVRRWAEVCNRRFEEIWPPGEEISNRACNGGTGSPFLTSQTPPDHKTDTTLTSRRRVA